MEPIRIDVGVYTPIVVDLSKFDFDGIEKVILTISNTFSPEFKIEKEFTEASEYDIEITPSESLSLQPGAQYDFDIVTTTGKRFKNGENGQIVLRVGCGQWTETE